MALAPGDRVGSYEIVAPLGTGGMGEVYRARDATLGRDVAIKVLPAAFTTDGERLARFEREARILASLNHPHVGTIYEIENFGHGRALVLELVEGPTLADRIARGPVPIAEALRIASQLAAAIDAAHTKGIIHRDLKPANIKITPEGTVKVLDFGLAKIAQRSEPDSSRSPTVTADGTRAGAILGTAAYMSPEQARGDIVDARTDIWATGCIVFEMLTGRRAYDGRTASDTIAKILEREPDWSLLPRGTPAAIDELLKRCLAKDLNQRFQNMSGVRALLDWSSSPVRRRKLAPLAAAGLGVVAIAAVAVGLYTRVESGAPTPTDSSQWEQITDFPDAATQPSLSRDGRMLAFIRGEDTFATPGQVYLKHLPDGVATPLTSDDRIKMDPVFSPDGNRLAYTVTSDGSSMIGWHTWQVPIVRGEPRLWLMNASGLTWTGPDRILFSEIKRGNHMGVVTATEARGDRRELYFPEDQNGMAHRSALSPDGQWVLLVEMGALGIFTPCRLIPAGGASAGRLVGPQPGRCLNVAWSPDGSRMYFTVDTGQGAHLWQQRFPNGPPEQLTIGTATQEDGLAIAPNGRSVISSVGQQRRGIWMHEPSGERQISHEGYAYWPLLSADGSKLAFRVSRGVGGGGTPTELWMTDLQSRRFERIFPGQMVVQYDLSRDDRIVASVVEGDSKSRLWVAWLDGREPPRALGIESANARFGPDGVIVFIVTAGGASSLYRTDVDGTTPRKLSPDNAGNILGTVSSDGSWVTVGRGTEMIAVSLTGAAPVLIVRNAVARMRWTPDGKHVLIAVQSGPGPSAFGFGRTYVLPVERSMLPRIPPGGFKSEAEIAEQPGVQIIPYGDLMFGSAPGVYTFSKITVTRNLYRIPLQ